MSMMHKTNKRFVLATCAAAFLTLAACGDERSFSSQLSDRDLFFDPVPENEIAEAPFAHSIGLDTGQVRLDGTQNADLSIFLAGIGRDRGDHYEIRTAYSTNDQVQMGRNNEIARDLRSSFISQGVQADRIQLVHVPGHEDTLELVVRRYTVISPACGVVDVDLRNDWRNEPTQTRKLGCSNAHNLGQMLADPRDLVGGRTMDSASGERETIGVRQHGEGTIPKIEVDSASTSSKQQ
jgi:pilus biogenesis lipoprotein CpaD